MKRNERETRTKNTKNKCETLFLTEVEMAKQHKRHSTIQVKVPSKELNKRKKANFSFS